MENTISQYAIGELLDGRYFYIPAYQRGYRWTEDQVSDLLRDMLCFANDCPGKDDFYCLQPVIARPITDPNRLAAIFKGEIPDDAIDKGVWEIIDGQQRLTTIYLIFKHLTEDWTEEIYEDKMPDQTMFKIIYATRENSAEFLRSTLDIDVPESKSNVDYYHMSNAFASIKQWIKNEGREIMKRYRLKNTPAEVKDKLFSILTNTRDIDSASVQVLWYELEESHDKNAMREFQKINTGLIRLTDAELVKGLFLMKRNFIDHNKSMRQSEIALEWEMIENTLHSPGFWWFLQKKGQDMPNRIDLIFSLLYKITKLKEHPEIPEDNWSVFLADIDTELQDKRKSVVFRHYFNTFEGLTGEELENKVCSEWQKVMELFRTLDDWYSTPRLYNYIGLLSQCGEDLSRIIFHFDNMPHDANRNDLEEYLKNRIRKHLRDVRVELSEADQKPRIVNSYIDRGSRALIFKLLLTLNVHLLNEQNKLLDLESEMYKFPFEALRPEKIKTGWDIEHIDSAHTNELKSTGDKQQWIEQAIADQPKELSPALLAQLEDYRNRNMLEDAIQLLKDNAGEIHDDILKNQIGNLSLLDAGTNRSYGNALFSTKRRRIIESIEKGVFVPTATQYVFFKLFDPSGLRRSFWTAEDMEAYHDFIYRNLKDYLTTPQTNQAQ